MVKWNKEMINFLKYNKDKLSNKEISIKLNVTKKSVSDANFRYGIKKDVSKIKKRMFKEKILVPHNKGKSFLVGKNNPMYGVTHPKKTIEIIRKKNIENGIYNKLSLRMKNNNPSKNGLTKEWKINIGKASKKLWMDEDYRKKMLVILNKIRPSSKDFLFVEGCRKRAKRQWSNETSRTKLIKSLHLKPNKIETKAIKIIKNNGIDLYYVGDGKLWIRKNLDVFNPDFINKKKKIIVEIFGDYWHNLPKAKERDKKRIKVYNEKGYKLLIIWEHELKNESLFTDKLKNLMEHNNGITR